MSCSLNPCQFSAYDFLSCPTKNSLAFNPPVCVDCVSTLHWQHRLSQFSSIQSLSCVRLFATPWTAAHQASLSTTSSRSLLKLMSTESVMPSNHLILAVALRPNSLMACGILVPRPGIKPAPLPWKADSSPLDHQASPLNSVLNLKRGFVFPTE